MKKFRIKFVTEPRQDKNGNTYVLIYTPDIWEKDDEDNVTKTAGEQHFCYDEDMFEHLVVGNEITIQ